VNLTGNDFLDKLVTLGAGHLKILTIAAELPGAVEFTKYCVEKHGLVVALGHQLAMGRDIDACAAAGATLLTHLGNGLPNDIHRHHNSLWPALANDSLSASLITDSFHLPPAMIKSMTRAKGIERVVIVSDILFLGGCAPGDYSNTSHMPLTHCNPALINHTHAL
jgi:N-acetylglucosamine-6-phosphate deacetylase